MSSRALRRLRDTKLDIAAQHDSSEEDDVVEPPKKAQNLFDLLGADEANESADNDSEREEPIEYNEPAPKSPAAKIKGKSKSKSKNSKKSRKNGNKLDTSEISMEELDKAIQEVTGASPSKEETKANEGIEKCRRLLSINSRMLNAEAEMKRKFGARVVNNEKRTTKRTIKISKLTTPKGEWPPYKNKGLSMELLEVENGVEHFSFTHMEQYQDAQLDFMNAVAMMDPNVLLMLTRRHQYHVDSLLQLSEVAKQSGDWSAAGDLIERALYSCERSFHPQFRIETGAVRLSYRRAENRSFFLAVSRHVQFLERRGCWRTAFEFNKLLFSMDPLSDPLCALLSLDYSAIMAHEYEYVLQMLSSWKTDGTDYPTDLSEFPNFKFSAAYCKRKLSTNTPESKTEGSILLQEAIQKFPDMVPRLLTKLDESDMIIDPINETNPLLDLLQQLYVERNWELWKEPEMKQWLKESARTVVQQSKGKQPEHSQWKDIIPLNVSRHVIVADIQQSLLSYLPRSATGQGYQMYDPLPPPDSTTGYDINDRMRRSGSRGSRNDEEGLSAMLQRLLLQGAPLGLNFGQDQLPGTFPAENSESDESDEIEENNDHNDEHGNETDEDEDEDAALLEQEDLDIQRALAESMERHN